MLCYSYIYDMISITYFLNLNELYRRKDVPLPPPINPFWRASVNMCIVLLFTVYLKSLLVSLTVR